MSNLQTETHTEKQADTGNSTPNAPTNPWLKLALEMGPLMVFFVLNSRADIMTATGGFMIATVISLVASKILIKKIPTMPLVSGVLVMIFGGLTLYLNDEMFIKLKPTIVNTMFGLTLLIAQIGFQKPLLKIVMGDAMPIRDEGWNILSIRWGFFFLFLAVLNEVVWRNFDNDTWVSFKVFGVMPITVVFALSQMPIMTRYAIDSADEPAASTDAP